MTFRQAFVDAVARLRACPNPSESPELDARVLLAHAAELSHAGLLARWGDVLSSAVGDEFETALVRRLQGEPVAWITGVKEFVGLDFVVRPGLLVPRADTETLVEAALEVLAGQGGRRVLDVCTGTGCVAVGLAALSPAPTEVWACDLSPLAVETAQQNAQALVTTGRRVTVVESDLMQGLAGTWDLVVSNPPYLTPDETNERVGPLGWREPALALDGGGQDGLALIRRLLNQAVPTLNPRAWLLLEAADAQMDAIADLMRNAGLTEVRIWKDLGAQRRVIGGRRP